MPAIWMMPVREAYGNWPTSGEVDIVEARGNKDFFCGDNGPQIGKGANCVNTEQGTDPNREGNVPMVIRSQ